MDAGVLVAVAALVTAAGSILVPWWQRRKVSADASDKISRVAMSLIEPLEARIAELETQARVYRSRITDLENALLEKAGNERRMQTQIDELSGGVMVLIAQLEEKDIKPRWKPKTGPLGEKQS